jgi:hypothetical protein
MKLTHVVAPSWLVIIEVIVLKVFCTGLTMPVVKTTPPRKGREGIRIVKPFPTFLIDRCTAGVLSLLCFLILLFDFSMFFVVNVTVLHVLCGSS